MDGYARGAARFDREAESGRLTMALTLFAFPGRPHDFAVTKQTELSAEECAFLLDFSRPLEKFRNLAGWHNTRVGFTDGLFVPVVHVGEQSGGFKIGVSRGRPYFTDIQKLWKIHRGSERTLAMEPAGGLEIIADFGRHFPEDCQQVTEK